MAKTICVSAHFGPFWASGRLGALLGSHFLVFRCLLLKLAKMKVLVVFYSIK